MAKVFGFPFLLDSFTARLMSEGSRSYGAASHQDAEGAATGRSARSARSAHSAVSARSTGGGGGLRSNFGMCGACLKHIRPNLWPSEGNPQSFFPTPASNFKSEVAKDPHDWPNHGHLYICVLSVCL